MWLEIQAFWERNVKREAWCNRSYFLLATLRSSSRLRLSCFGARAAFRFLPHYARSDQKRNYEREKFLRQTFTQVLISMSLLFVNKDSKWVTRVSPFEEVDGELSESYPNVNHCCFRYLGFEAELSRSQVVKFFLPKHFAKLKRILCCGVTSANSQPWQYHVSPKNAWNASLPSLRPAFALSRWISESRVSIKIILVIWFGALAQQVFGLIS